MTSATTVLSLRAEAEALATRTQAAICSAVERLEGDRARFCDDTWTRVGGGGGRSRVLRDGKVFESAGVNVAVVHGRLPREMAEIAQGDGARLAPDGLHFWASGVSIVLHARNPMVPTAHANYRYFELAGAEGEAPISRWFGGGADLTPAYLFEEDARHFHAVHKEACDRHGPGYHRRFKARCDEYFRLLHRDESRGVGGIFFDRLEDGDPAELLALVTSCAEAFEPAYFPIVERRKDLPFSAKQVEWQQVRRGRYVEFNLLYDRGTHFGLRTGGRTESILMSLPPVARWKYSHEPAAGSDEAKLVAALRTPREWA